jgi:hypothetical protein
MPVCHFNPEVRNSAIAGARMLRLDSARRRAVLDALAVAHFEAWAREHGFDVSRSGAHAADPDLAELLAINDVQVNGRRVDVRGLLGPGQPAPWADPLAVYGGFHADLYAFVEIDPQLLTGRLLGVAPLAAFTEDGWYEPEQGRLVLARETLVGIDRLADLLGAAAAAPPLTEPSAHTDVFAQLAAYASGELPAEERAPLESHLFSCVACRAELIAIRAVRERMRTRVPVATASRGDVVFLPARDFVGRRAAKSATAGYALHRDADVPLLLYLSDWPDDAPRILSDGRLAGVLLLADAALDGRRVRVTLRMNFDGAVVPAFETRVAGDELRLGGRNVPADVCAWLSQHLEGTPALEVPAEALDIALLED